LHNFRHTPSYNFSQLDTEDHNRFVLHFTPPAEIVTVNSTCNGDGAINITQPGIANWNYAITDAQYNIVGSGILNSTTSVSVNQLEAGIYTLTLSDNMGYVVVKNITVGGANTIDATFTTSAPISEVYQDITFSNSTPNAVDYEWEFGDGTIITGVANPVYSFSEPGVYTVTLTVTNSDGCTSSSTQTITINESTTGLQNLPEGAVNIFSFRNFVAVDFSKLQAVDATIQVYNLIGQEISNEKFNLSTIYRKDILDVEAAYVIVKVRNGNGFMTKKVFVTSR